MNNIPESLLEIIQIVCEDKPDTLAAYKIETRTNLRNDLQLDSLELAELSVRIEDAYGVDIFRESSIESVGDILQNLPS